MKQEWRIFGLFFSISACIALPAVSQSPGETFVVDASILRASCGDKPCPVHVRIVVTQGKISCIGQGKMESTDSKLKACAIPENARTYDFSQKGVITAGFVETLSHIGQIEVDAEDQSHDGVAGKDSNLAHVRAIDGIAMNSRAMEAARNAGVTVVVVRPLGNALIAGQSVALRTSGLTVDQALIKDSVAMHVNLGEEARADMPLVGARSGQIALLRNFLVNAKRLADADKKKPKDAAEKDSIQRLKDDPGIAALAEVIWRKKAPLVVHAHRSDEIAAALRLQKELGFQLVIAGGAEAHLLVKELHDQKVPVIVGPVRVSPFGWNTRQARAENAGILHQIPGDLALATADTHNARNLRFEAGYAQENGLLAQNQPEIPVALHAVTDWPAQILGLPQTGPNAVGQVLEGQIADFVVLEGDPLSYDGHVVFVSAGGKAIESPHQR